MSGLPGAFVQFRRYPLNPLLHNALRSNSSGLVPLATFAFIDFVTLGLLAFGGGPKETDHVPDEAYVCNPDAVSWGKPVLDSKDDGACIL